MFASIAAVLIWLEVSTTAAPTPETLYDEGKAAFDGADYATAIAKWSQSYRLSNAAGLLFNLAQAYRLSGDCRIALSTYRKFISMDPAAEQRSLADDLVRELDQKCGTPVRLTQAPIVAAANPGRTLKIVGLITGGAGIASIAIGIGLGHHASTLGDEVTRACSVSCDWSVESAEKSKDASGRRYATLGHALDAIGVAAIVGGAILYYLGDRESEIHVTPLSARPQESGAVISWSTSW